MHWWQASQAQKSFCLMAELRDLYPEVILEHSKHPRNFRAMETANRKAERYYPLCGDHYTIFVDVADDTIPDISFQGSGCAISKASASMMSQAIKNKTTAEAEDLFVFLALESNSKWSAAGKALAAARKQPWFAYMRIPPGMTAPPSPPMFICIANRTDLQSSCDAAAGSYVDARIIRSAR